MAAFVERHSGGTGVPAPLPAPSVGRLGILQPGAPRIGGLLISVEPEGQPAGVGGSAVAHRLGARARVARNPGATRQGRKRTAEAVDGGGAEAGAEGSTPSDALPVCFAGGGAQATGAVSTYTAGAGAPALLGPGAGGFAPSHRSTARGGSSRCSSATRQGRKRTAEAVAEGGVEAGYGHLGAMVAAEAKWEVGIDTSGFSCLLEPVGDDSSD